MHLVPSQLRLHGKALSQRKARGRKKKKRVKDSGVEEGDPAGFVYLLACLFAVCVLGETEDHTEVLEVEIPQTHTGSYNPRNPVGFACTHTTLWKDREEQGSRRGGNL